MLNAPGMLPSDSGDLCQTAESPVQLVMSHALSSPKLKDQPEEHRHHRFTSKSETTDYLQLWLEEGEPAVPVADPLAQKKVGSTEGQTLVQGAGGERAA